MKLKLTALLMAVGLVIACSGGDNNDSGDYVVQGRPIINGLPVDQPMHNAVVSLHQREGSTWYLNIFCSGTLISSDVVLTAAHCLDVGRNKPVTMSPDALVIYVGDNPMTDPEPVPYVVSETFMHPSYSSRNLTDDIAMLRLATPVTGVTPVPALPASLGFVGSDEGTLTLNFAGFGADENDNYDQKLQLDGTLGTIYSDTQIYYEQQAGGPCFGDSGGPAFLFRNGKAYVGGMTSYGDQYCASYGVSTRADAYETMIHDFVGVVVDPFCGDGTCDADEDCATCAADCGTCPVDPFCGDDTCDADEDCATCPADCGACPVDPFCGDNTCDAGLEDCVTCPGDCGDCPVVPECGDGECNGDEDCSSCSEDCGDCPTSFCGDGTCDAGENCQTCGSDCQSYVHPRKGLLACCGNGLCERKEDSLNCAIDCQ